MGHLLGSRFINISEFCSEREGAEELDEQGRRDILFIGSRPNISASPSDTIKISGKCGNTDGYNLIQPP